MIGKIKILFLIASIFLLFPARIFAASGPGIYYIDLHVMPTFGSFYLTGTGSYSAFEIYNSNSVKIAGVSGLSKSLVSYANVANPYFTNVAYIKITLNAGADLTGIVAYPLYSKGGTPVTFSDVGTTVPVSYIPTFNDLDIKNLDRNVTSNGAITLTWDAINSTNLKIYKIYKDNVFLSVSNTNSFSISGLEQGVNYHFSVTAVDIYDREYNASVLDYTVPLPDTISPAVPTGVVVTPDLYKANVIWDQVSDTDLLGYYLYLDDVRINPTPVLTNSFQLINLDADKDYSLQIVAVDTSGNVSEKSAKANFKTRNLLSAPLTPGGLVASSFFEGVTLSWLPSTGASEYSIYLDGHFLVKTNSTFIKFSGLKNGQSYAYQIMASNDIGDSALSAAVSAVPEDSLPVDVSLGYDLSDLAKGTSNWLTSFWPMLAFCVAIPLGFYVGNRIKGLFVS